MVKVIFFKKVDAVVLPHKSLKTSGINFIHLYKGKMMAEIKVERLPYRQEILSVFASILKSIMGRMSVMKATFTNVEGKIHNSPHTNRTESLSGGTRKICWLRMTGQYYDASEKNQMLWVWLDRPHK